MTAWSILECDCIQAMAAMDEASVDAVVTDPPYLIGFMGKAFDSQHKTFVERKSNRRAGSFEAEHGNHNPVDSADQQRTRLAEGRRAQDWHEAWAREALRVLKPGGHLIAFGGTRTYHRLVAGIEDAGFEIRDQLAWMFGSGFPKSLDVSKAIDRQRKDNPDWQQVGRWLRARRWDKQMSVKALCAAIGAHGEVNHGGAVSNWENGFSCPTWEQWEAMRGVLRFGNSMDAEVWRLNGRKGQPGENWERRELIESRTGPRPGDHGGSGHYGHGEDRSVTAPATPDAERWQGWGTALKPGFEPIVLARKPLTGTVAATVLEHGTGALNVDACRIGTEESLVRPPSYPGMLTRDFQAGLGKRPEGEPWGREGEPVQGTQPAGRWPSNVILDPEAAAMLDEQTGDVRSAGAYIKGNGTQGDKIGAASIPIDGLTSATYADTGGASRFFYCAKTSSAERNAGLDGFEAEKANPYGGRLNKETVEYGDGAKRSSDRPPRQNVHPTVKPIDLMRWLVRLVTPPGGTVLDCFAGSGTTGAAAMLEGFDFVGIEREPEYAAIARARIAWWAAHPDGMSLVHRLEHEAEAKAKVDAGQLDIFSLNGDAA